MIDDGDSVEEIGGEVVGVEGASVKTHTLAVKNVPHGCEWGLFVFFFFLLSLLVQG
jgi:hypothetical protein